MIRLADVNDVDEIHAIEKRVFRYPWNKYQLLHELEQKSGKRVYAEIQKRIIGYIMLHVVNNEAQILNIAIDLPFQHRGYGKKLLKHTLQELGNDKNIFLEVRESNLPAIRLYNKFNFEENDIREHYYSDGENAIVMQKKAKVYGLV